MQPSQIVTVAPQSVQMQVPSPVHARSRHSCTVKTLGILQMINSGLSMVIGITIFAVGTTFVVAAFGIAGGLLLYLPAGLLGVLSVTAATSSRRTFKLAIACMVMSILSAVAAAVNTGFLTVTVIGSRNALFYTEFVLDCVLAGISFFELVVAIGGAVYCCLIMPELPSSTNTVCQYVATPYSNPITINPPGPKNVPSGGDPTAEQAY